MIRKLMILSVAFCVSCSLFGLGEHETYDEERNRQIALKNARSDLAIQSFLGFEFGKTPADCSVREIQKDGKSCTASVGLKTPWRGFKGCMLFFTEINGTPRLSGISMEASTSDDDGAYKGWSREDILMEKWKIVDMFEKKYHITMTKTAVGNGRSFIAEFKGLNAWIKFDCITLNDILIEVYNREIKRKKLSADDGFDRL